MDNVKRLHIPTEAELARATPLQGEELAKHYEAEENRMNYMRLIVDDVERKREGYGSTSNLPLYILSASMQADELGTVTYMLPVPDSGKPELLYIHDVVRFAVVRGVVIIETSKRRK